MRGMAKERMLVIGFMWWTMLLTSYKRDANENKSGIK